MLWQMLVRSQILRCAQNDAGTFALVRMTGRHAVTLSEAKGLPSAWSLGY
jgi:hypothetical protein